MRDGGEGIARGVVAALAWAIIPAAVVAWLYHADLGHRRDYLGHYAAGYGGTLCALACGLVLVPRSVGARPRLWGIVGATLVCIGLGTITEATIFRYAKFDPVDYCNQNLGAAFAGLIAAAHVTARPPSFFSLVGWLVTGLGFLWMGFHHAFR